MQLNDSIKEFIKREFPNLTEEEIENMSKEELQQFKTEVIQKRQEYFQLEMAMKRLGNAAYGAAANRFFYFYNNSIAADITAECRNLTKTMWKKLEEFFHEEIWNRKDLWKEYDFELDESKHDWYRKQPVSIYSDTDSCYTTFGTFFEAMTKESKNKYDTDKKKLDFILKFNQGFVNKQNKKWCEEIYNPRHGHNIHEFELETVSYAGIYLKKKKYLKGLAFSKGKYFKEPKVSGTGIELVKSTTPKLCRKILTDLMESLMFEYNDKDKDAYLMYFNDKLINYRKEFWNSPIEDISQSVSIGNYKKYVIEDEDNLILGKQCPVSVHGIARFNWLAHRNGEDNKRVFSGKIKYYNIRLGSSNKDTGYFAFPAGEIPTWAPPIDKTIQWQKNVIDPINRFLEVMMLPLANSSNTIQYTLF